VVGEVVVVFDGGEGCGFAEEAEMVDGDGVREDGLKGLGGPLVRYVCWGVGELKGRTV
jgi:hypothetical protein